MLITIPHYVEAPAYVEAHATVAPGSNWNLAENHLASPLHELPALPGKAPAATPQYETVYFATASAKVRPAYATQLGKLDHKPAYAVEGHADPRGGKRLNNRLSLHRAQSVKHWLTAHHYTVKAVHFYGKQHPASHGDKRLFSLDRRVDVKPLGTVAN